MENLLAFGIGIATCLVIIVSIYGIITIRNLNNSIEELEDELDDTRGELNKFKREVESKPDSTSEIKDTVDKLIIDMNNRFTEIDEDLEDIEDQLNQLQIKE